jgi:hypothetical protein
VPTGSPGLGIHYRQQPESRKKIFFFRQKTTDRNLFFFLLVVLFFFFLFENHSLPFFWSKAEVVYLLTHLLFHPAVTTAPALVQGRHTFIRSPQLDVLEEHAPLRTLLTLDRRRSLRPQLFFTGTHPVLRPNPQGTNVFEKGTLCLVRTPGVVVRVQAGHDAVHLVLFFSGSYLPRRQQQLNTRSLDVLTHKKKVVGTEGKKKTTPPSKKKKKKNPSTDTGTFC